MRSRKRGDTGFIAQIDKEAVHRSVQRHFRARGKRRLGKGTTYVGGGGGGGFKVFYKAELQFSAVMIPQIHHTPTGLLHKQICQLQNTDTCYSAKNKNGNF